MKTEKLLSLIKNTVLRQYHYYKNETTPCE